MRDARYVAHLMQGFTQGNLVSSIAVRAGSLVLLSNCRLIETCKSRIFTRFFLLQPAGHSRLVSQLFFPWKITEHLPMLSEQCEYPKK